MAPNTRFQRTAVAARGAATALDDARNDLMKPSEVEEWTLRILEAHRRGHTLEDSRYELKQEWIDPFKAARRLAGHANASQGEPILWIIGANECGEIVEIQPTELADWWPRVVAHFAPPALEAQPTTVFAPDRPVVSLLFETTRAPYLVRNPSYGKRESGPIELEVPWREMTAVRTARHADLIRILVPQSRLPIVDVISNTLAIQGRVDPRRGERMPPAIGDHCGWELNLSLFLVPRSPSVLVFPAHKLRLQVRNAALGEVDFRAYELARDIVAFTATDQRDIVLEYPRRVDLRASYSAVLTRELEETATCRVTLLPAGGSTPLLINCQLSRQSDYFYSLEGWEGSTT